MFSFCGFSYNSTMYEHVVNYSPVSQYCKLSTAPQSARTKPQRKYVSIRVRKQHTESTYCISTASTAQHSAISPHKAAKQVRRSECESKKADIIEESQHYVQH